MEDPDEASEYPDWIELYNPGNEVVDLGGMYLTDDLAEPTKWRIPEGVIIGPGEYLVFWADDDDEQGDRHTNFQLDKAGDENAYPKVGPIVISEIMYNPRDPNMGSPYTDNDDFEYVELYNITGSAVTLQEYDNELQIDVGWRFTDEDESIDFVFPLSTTIPPSGYLLLVKDEDAFNYRYTAGGGVQILEWGDGKCNNGGEKINLQMPGDMVAGERYYIRIDRVNYSDGSHPEGADPWPSEPDGTGQSLHRIVPANYGNDVANWQGAWPGPGL